MIAMPPNYIEYCKKYSKLTASTMYKYHKRPEPYGNEAYSYYAYADRHMVGSGDPTGRFDLLYALRSYPKMNDSSKYTLYVLASDGVYVEENGFRAIENEPIKFCNVYLLKLGDFSAMGNLVIDKPGTRALQFIYNYKYQEEINGIIMPNSFDFFYHKDEYPDECVKSHNILVTGKDVDEPISLEYNKALYKAIKDGRTYLHLRADNYIDFKLLDTYHPSF